MAKPYTLEQRIATRFARKMFEIRGNHTEAHLRESELSFIIEEAIKLYVQVGIAQGDREIAEFTASLGLPAQPAA